MKKQLAYALATLLLLTGCAAGDPAAQVASSTAAAAPSTPAEPVPMSIEEAGAYYLTHVCPMNTVVDEFNDVYLAAYAEVEAGGNPSLDPLLKVTAKLRDAHRDLADAFSEEDIRWPSVVEEQIDPFLDSEYDSAGSMASLATVKTTDQFFAVMAQIEHKEAQSDGAAVAQKIRAKLGLLADTVKSCENHTES